METPDLLIVGGGIVGVCLALEARRRDPTRSVVIIEKEADLGYHASGRNSGVVHAGFYYTPDSLKARLTREGNRALTSYAESRGLRLRRCGKLVVARGPADLPGMDELLRRARANDVELEEVSEAEARRIEPRARTFERALFSPTTSSVDPLEILRSLAGDAAAAQVSIRTGTAYQGRSAGRVVTTTGEFSPGYLINAAGLHADRIARDFGFAADLRILPFKGLYLYGEPSEKLNVHVYPVPDLDYPFLGVHATATVDGKVKLGPTAIPALWRESYGGMAGFAPGDLLEILWRSAGLFAGSGGFDYRRLAMRELPKYSRRRLARLAGELVAGVEPRAYRRWGRPGIRAQLYDLRQKRLEMDFRYEGDDRSFHVLNAVSPAFTCAIPFGAMIMDQVERAMGEQGRPLTTPIASR